MNRLKDERNIRVKNMHFLANEEEEKLIRQKMKGSGVLQIGAYLRKMAIDGYIVNMDLSDTKEVIRLLRICSNNINQYAKKANETGSVYEEDILEIKQNQEELWKLMKAILDKLSSI